MRFSQLDFIILLIMTLFVILVSFTFPAIGFSAENVNESDIPDFNASANQFDNVPEKPDYPSTPTSGTLEYVANEEPYQDNRQVWLQQDSVLISLTNNPGNLSSPQPEINLIKFNDTGDYKEQTYINESEYKQLENFSYLVEFDNVKVSNINQSNLTISADWELEKQPSDESWVSRIPIVGGLVSGTNQLAAVVSWGISVIFHPVLVGMQRVANMGVVLFNIISFIFSFVHWLLAMYAGITTSSPAGWVSVFLAIPGVILSLEFMKLTLIMTQTVIKAIPFT